jgi:hypothetical protein
VTTDITIVSFADACITIPTRVAGRRANAPVPDQRSDLMAIHDSTVAVAGGDTR